MSINDADDFLRDDILEIEGLINSYERTKNSSYLFQIAWKYNELADLYYEAMEDFNSRFFEYKFQSAEYYDKISKEVQDHDVRSSSKILTILLLIQAGKTDKAEKKLKLLRRKLEIQPDPSISLDLLFFINLLLIPSLNRAKKELKNLRRDLDENLYKVLVKTIEILEKLEK